MTIAAAMLPASALEGLLARCTELGAAGFVLLKAERSVARGGNPQRWATICREAAMLAGRFSIPEVRGPLTVAQALQAPASFLLDRAGTMRLADLAAPADLTLLIGPEGGWTDAERELAGERLLRLGNRNLRSETAAAAALAIALATRGD